MSGVVEDSKAAEVRSAAELAHLARHAYGYAVCVSVAVLGLYTSLVSVPFAPYIAVRAR